MTRVAVCGGPDLVAVAAALGLVEAPEPEVVLVDIRSADAVARAGTFAATTPRVIVADGQNAAMLRAAGALHVATVTSPETLGPLVTAALPQRTRDATRSVVITGARGGVGRTLLATNLARRVAPRRPLWLVDATGTGSAAWWLRGEARPWPELEPLTNELSIEHLRIVAAEPVAGIRLLGGAGAAPSGPLLNACLRELAEELVIVDAGLLADERTRSLNAIALEARRTLVLTYADPVSLAALEVHDLSAAWLIASQGRLAQRDAFRTLPRDDGAVGAALAGRGAIGGKLGRAYDDLAEIIAIDAT